MPSTKPASRFAWVDAVRGACVLAVVLLHFCLAGFYPYTWGTRTADAWVVVNDVLTAVRMPTLFAISGFLLASRIRQGWSDPRTRYSAVHTYYLYAVWLLIYALLAPWFATGARPLTSANGWGNFASQLVNPHTMLWFLLGLVFWTVVLASLRSVPAWLVLPGLLIVSMLSFEIEWATQQDFYIRILRYGFYFAVGVYLRPLIANLINARLWWTLAGSTVAFVGLRTLLAVSTSLGVPPEIVAPLRDLAAVGVAMSVVAVIVSYIAPVRQMLSWVGARTLPIYVLHSLVIWSLVKLPGWGYLVKLPVHKHVAPALWTVLVAIVCIGIYALIQKTPARYVFDMPQKWRTVLRKEGSTA